VSHPTRGRRGRHRRRRWGPRRHATWSMRSPRPHRWAWPHRFVRLCLALARGATVCGRGICRAGRRMLAVAGRGRSRGPGTSRLADLLAVTAAASLAAAGPTALSVLTVHPWEITMTGHRSRSTPPPDPGRQHRHSRRTAIAATGAGGCVPASGRSRSASRAPGAGCVTPVLGEQERRSVLPLYTPRAAAELLAVRESWLRRKAAARAVPCTFIGRHLRFSRADLEAIAQAAAHPPLTGPEPLPGRELNPAPASVEVENELPTAVDADQTPRSRSTQRPPRRRGPNKASRHRQTTAAAENGWDGWGRAA
jgi:excisionase family DNA binding protein